MSRPANLARTVCCIIAESCDVIIKLFVVWVICEFGDKVCHKGIPAMAGIDTPSNFYRPNSRYNLMQLQSSGSDKHL